MNTVKGKVSVLFATLLAATPCVQAADGKSFLETIRHQRTLTSTVPHNGDVNPYAVVVAPVSAGKIQKGDVLVDNFNGLSNLQGTGVTIVDYSPATKKITTFAQLPQKLRECPGGVGLSTAMTMLKTGWVIVGSAPSIDGTTRTLGPGCLLVLDLEGQLVATWANANINAPWGNMAAIDNGSTASLFVSMSGFDVPGPEVKDPATGYPVTVKKATVLRIDLSIPEGKPPVIIGQAVIAEGRAASGQVRLPDRPDRIDPAPTARSTLRMPWATRSLRFPKRLLAPPAPARAVWSARTACYGVPWQ